MSVAEMAKVAAENIHLKAKVKELEAKVAASQKRAEAEAFLGGVMKDPRAPLDMKPVDIEDFLSKRAEIEKLPDIKMASAAIKMASTGSFAIGAEDLATASPVSNTGSRAEDEFVSSFLTNPSDAA